MSQLLEKKQFENKQIEYRTPTRRSLVLEFTLMAAGALAALFGAYTYFAPTDWVLADLVEGWHLGSFALGGLLLGSGFGVMADRMFEVDGYRSTRVIAGIVLALAAIAAAVTFALIWII